MNILYTFNDKFVPQVAAAITSVCENNKNVFEIHFYLMSLNVSQENEKEVYRRRLQTHSLPRSACERACRKRSDPW